MTHFFKKCKQIVAFWKPTIIEGEAPTTDATKTEESTEPAEIYRATDIYEILQRGTPEFLAWARKVGKSEQFMEGVRSITATEKVDFLEKIRHQMELERKRTLPEERKHIQASTMLAMLMNSPKSAFVDLYSSIYELSNSFHTKLDELIGQLALVGSEEGQELCKKFLRAENMRRKSKRNTDVRRELREVRVRAEWTAEPLRNMVVCEPCVEDSEETLTNTVACTPIEEPATATIEIVKAPSVKQWKTNEIYDDITTNDGSNYKAYCESHNKLDDVWESSWAELMKVKSLSLDSAKETISAFVNDLRRKRHNQLTDKKIKGKLLEREDRAAWPLTTIVFAFKQGKTEGFKKFMEELNAGYVKAWEAKWSTFVRKVEDAKDDDSKKEIISKFLTNMRTARYIGKQINKN